VYNCPLCNSKLVVLITTIFNKVKLLYSKVQLYFGDKKMSTPENQILNAKMEVVKFFNTKEGGTVYVYLVTSDLIDEFYVVTFYDGVNEVAWGMGNLIIKALKNAEKAWSEVEDNEQDSSDNPFTEVLIKLGIEGDE
jgi:hypothetical protein